jgi:hypothetical protein
VAKSFITGAASSPSNEEFQKRVARLSDMPVKLPTNKKHQNKSSKWSTARRQPEEPSDQSKTSDDVD